MLNTLHQDHLADLKRSGLTKETIEKAIIRSVPPGDINKTLGCNVSGLTSMYEISYLDTNGGKTGFSRYRCFYEEGKEGRRYFQKKNTGNHLYFPPGIGKLLKDSSNPICVIEGEKKALKAFQEGIACIGLGGLWNWSNGKRELIPDFTLIDFKGREVFIVPDNDWQSPNKHGYKKNLDQAVYGLAYKLIDCGATVRIVELPQGEMKGLDDYLCANTVDRFRQLPSETVKTLLEKAAEATRSNYELLLPEIASLSDEIKKELICKTLAESLDITLGTVKKAIKAINRQGSKENNEEGCTMCASFHGLVDLVIKDGKVAFLYKSQGSLKVDFSFVDDGTGQVCVPPEINAIPFDLSPASKILTHLDGDDNSLYFDVVKTLKGISVLPGEEYYHLCAIYIFFTYMSEQSSYSPYLWVFGLPERGKSRITKAIINLSYRGLYTETLNEAYIFRYADLFHGTLGLDLYELSEKAKKQGSHDLLLNRYEKGGKVARVISPDKGPFKDTTYYDVYGPTIMATNVEIPIKDPLRSRCIKMTMPEARGKYPNNNSKKDLFDLKTRLTAFRARHLGEKLPEVEKPTEGRLGDIIQPLLCVAKLLPQVASDNLYKLITAFENERQETESESLAGRIAAVLYEIKDQVEHGRLPVAEIQKKVNEDITEKYQIAPQTIGRELSAMGIEKKKSNGRMFIIWNPKIIEKIWRRFLPCEYLPNLPNLPNPDVATVTKGEVVDESLPSLPEFREEREQMDLFSLDEKSYVARNREIREDREVTPRVNVEDDLREVII